MWRSYDAVRSLSVLFVLGLTALLAQRFDASNSQCLPSSSNSRLNEAVRRSCFFHESLLVFAAGQRRGKPLLRCIAQKRGTSADVILNYVAPDKKKQLWCWSWEKKIIFFHGQNKPKPDLSSVFQHLLIIPVPVPFLDHHTQAPR